MRNKKYVILTLWPLFLFLVSSFAFAIPVGSCNPASCPQDYNDEGISCNNGSCIRICTQRICSGSFTTVHTESISLDTLDDEGGWTAHTASISSYTPSNSSRCYRFRNTGLSLGFVTGSDIDGQVDTGDFDSGIALFWGSSGGDRWFNNQLNYCQGENSQFAGISSSGAVWIDSDAGNGDDFDDADSFNSNTNHLYCAPDGIACSNFNSNCDTDCYNKATSLKLGMVADIDNDFDGNSPSDFCNEGPGQDAGNPTADFIHFDTDTITMSVDEYSTTIAAYSNQSCSYWPQCNPADPCCDENGNFRSNGYVCKSAHNPQCTSAGSGGCSGTAVEDRCTGTSSLCPDSNNAITYDQACDGTICVGQSCSNSLLQPERVCDAGVCIRNDAYNCPYNLNCESASKCKNIASSSSDCAPGFDYDSTSKVCWKSTSGQNLTYDSYGNLISGFDQNYTYDRFNRLISVKNSSSGSLKEMYEYNANERVKKVRFTGAGTNTTTYYINDNFVQIRNSSGVYNETYYYLYDTLIGKKDTNGNSLFFHPDHLGSTRLITGSSGNTIANISYEPFGDLLSSSSERFTYTNKEFDSSGLLYYGARYRDPNSVQSFIQPDEKILNIYSPQNLNLYSYVLNNPLKYIDPTGKYVESIVDNGNTYIHVNGEKIGVIASGPYWGFKYEVDNKGEVTGTSIYYDYGVKLDNSGEIVSLNSIIRNDASNLFRPDSPIRIAIRDFSKAVISFAPFVKVQKAFDVVARGTDFGLTTYETGDAVYDEGLRSYEPYFEATGYIPGSGLWQYPVDLYNDFSHYQNIRLEGGQYIDLKAGGKN